MKKSLGICLILMMTLPCRFFLRADSIDLPISDSTTMSGEVYSPEKTGLMIPVATIASGEDAITVDIPIERSLSSSPENIFSLEALSSTASSSEPPLFTGMASLIVSEVFFDGSDERFEITNIGSGAFLGPLVMRGVKSTDLLLGVIAIPPGGVLVRGDTMSQIVDRTIIRGSGLGLSISDTSALSISLYNSGQLLDTLSMDASIVSALPNNYGFEKLWSGGLLVAASTHTDRITNILGTWIANPGQIMTYQSTMTPFPFTGQTTPPFTGDFSTGGTITGEIISGAVLTGGTPFISMITISEIHPTNDMLPEYIELFFLGSFSGSMIIQGLGSSTSAKTFQLDVHTGQYVVFADTLSGFVDSSMVVLVDSISLTDGGEVITVVDALGRAYASIHYAGSTSGRSWYMSGSEPFRKDFPTPGFSEKALTYFSSPTSVTTTTKATTESSYYQGLYKKRKDHYYDLKSQISSFGLAVNKSGRAYKKTNSSEIELVEGAEEFAGEVVSSLSSQVKIVALLADETGKDEQNEQVSVELVSGDPIDLSSFVIHAGTKKTALGGLLQSPGDKQTIKATFGFTNKPTCITLEHNAVVHDTFCYGQPKAGVRIGLSGNIADDNALSGITDFSWMKELSFVVQTGQICAFFGDTSFSCQHLSPVVDAKKQASYQKKIDSLQKKFDKKATQYKTLQERYKKTKATLDAKWRKYYQQVKSVRNDYKTKLLASKLETKIRKNYDKIVQNYLKNNWAMVWQNPDILTLQQLLDANIAAMKTTSGDKTLSLEGYSFAIGDLKKQFAFKTDPSVFLDYFVGKGLALFKGELSNKRDKWVDQWYAKGEQ